MTAVVARAPVADLLHQMQSGYPLAATSRGRTLPWRSGICRERAGGSESRRGSRFGAGHRGIVAGAGAHAGCPHGRRFCEKLQIKGILTSAGSAYVWARLVNKSRTHKVGPIFVNTNYTFDVDRSTVLSYEVK